MKTELYIKNMVCPRCIAAVENLLNSNRLPVDTVELGKAVVNCNLSEMQLQQLGKELQLLGFELLDDRKKRICEQIKNAVVEFVHYQKGSSNLNLSDYIADRLHCDYSALSKIFSETENTTIEKYLIAQKTEKVKELLSYGELNLNQIADRLNYSSAAYLSSQFKAVTGMTPSQYKNSPHNKRLPLDSI
ncbi:MAG: helix-turn-helix transcriptional regulator [Bacteroidales bacterium]|nr:helix-turn-helix transcriptional regulator [Bacteroidales bacterium]